LTAPGATAVLQALEQDSQTKVLARPRVLTLDNESAIVRLSTNQTVGFESSSDPTTGITTVEPIRETTGIILSVTPQVNADNYITMLVEPSITKVVPAEVEPPADTGGIVDPKTRGTRTLVRIRNGDTLVVGGLIDRNEEKVVRRLPFLSRIPIIGEAFQNTETNQNETELIVFVTPTILEEGMEIAPTTTPRLSDGAGQIVSGLPLPLAANAQAPSRSAAMDNAMEQFTQQAQPKLSD
jgi:type II secretory pathway component GspD/PulD (secretin)